MATADSSVIAIVVPAIACEGISKLVLSQIKGLKEKHYRIVMVVLSSISEDIFEDFDVNFSDGQLLVLKQQHPYLSLRNFFTSVLLLPSIVRFFRHNNVNVVIAHAPYAHFVLRLVKLRLQYGGLKIKLIQYFHITQYAQFPLNTVRRGALNKLNKVLGKLYDDVHVFVSKAVKEDIERNFFSNPFSHIIYNALPKLISSAVPEQKLNNCAKQLCVNPDAFLVVVPGRIENSKGQLFFIQAFCSFLKQKSLSPNDIQVLMIGDGVQKRKVYSKIEECGLKEYVSLLGTVPNMELLRLMEQANLTILPSFFEGLPLVALEAMQSRGLLLTSDIASFKEIIENGRNGFLFKAGDITDFLDKMHFIYDNRNTKLIDLDEVAQQVEHKFSFERHIAQLIHAIRLVEAE